MRYLLLVLILVLPLAGCDTQEETYSIRYSVSGTAPEASVLWYDEDEALQSELGASLPWSYFMEADAGVRLRVTAVVGNYSGTVTARIIVDGEEVAEESARGPFNSAVATHTLR